MKITRPIIALDFPNKKETIQFLSLFPKDELLFVKVGMELFYSEGRVLLEEIKDMGHDIFLDLKCHDIPHTVNATMKVLGNLNVALTTVHAMGGTEMLKAAKEGLLDGSKGNSKTKLIAVTQLTSTDELMVSKEQLSSVSLKKSVLNYAKLAQKAGLDGVVCSAQEADDILKVTDKNFLRVTPGIRLENNDLGDQKRVVTPKQASKDNSSAIVVGRSITKANNPYETYKIIERMWNE